MIVKSKTKKSACFIVHYVAFILLLFILLLPHPSSADGCFFIRSEKVGNSAESPNQRAVIIHHEGIETLILQVKYSGNAADFSWIVPLPVPPKDGEIKTTSDWIFSELHNQTQPRVYYTSSLGNTKREGGGFSGEDSKLGQTTVWQILNVGPYEVAVISGTSSSALMNWLQNNDYDFPENAASTIDFYVQKNWCFVAMRVESMNKTTKSGSAYQAGLPPVEIRFNTVKPIFPLRISQISSAPQNEIELYLVNAHRMICENYQTVSFTNEEVTNKMRQGSGSKTGIACACKRVTGPNLDYEMIFRDKLAFYTKPTFICEAALPGFTPSENIHNFPGSFDGYFDPFFPPGSGFWVTRLRSVLNSTQMIQDMTFIQDSKGDHWLSLKIPIDDNHYLLYGMIYFIPSIFLLALIRIKKIRRYATYFLLGALLLWIIFA